MARVGAFDRQIAIEYPAKAADPVYGSEIVVWTPLLVAGTPPAAVRFWAEVKDMLPSRSEAITQGLVLARNQTRIRMLWRDDITSDMRVIVYYASPVIMQIVGGPAFYGRRQDMVEMVCERYSS